MKVEDFLKEICCDAELDECMLDLCKKCAVKDVHFKEKLKLTTEDLKKTVKYKQWEKDGGKPILRELSSSISDAVASLQKKAVLFKPHHHVKREQSHTFKTMTSNLQPGKVVLQIDFSENASIIQ